MKENWLFIMNYNIMELLMPLISRQIIDNEEVVTNDDVKHYSHEGNKLRYCIIRNFILIDARKHKILIIRYHKALNRIMINEIVFNFK